MKNVHTFVVLAYKESEYLEKCIKSVTNQSVKTNVVIATSTPNKFISNLAKKYKLEIIENKEAGKGIGFDFDFARTCVKSELVTIAHQDDIYDYTYAENMINAYKKYSNAIILFPNYYEIKNEDKIINNTNLKIKRFLLFLLRFKFWSGSKFIKRSALRLGDAIGCPSVTFVNAKCPKRVFDSDMKCNIDWFAWEKLSKVKGKFIYINKFLMGHRIHEESTTTKIIGENTRTKEDLYMFKKFWPTPIAKLINNFYINAEKNNKVS